MWDLSSILCSPRGLAPSTPGQGRGTTLPHTVSHQSKIDTHQIPTPRLKSEFTTTLKHGYKQPNSLVYLRVRGRVSVLLTCALFSLVSLCLQTPPDPLRYHPPVSPSVPAPVPTAGPPYYPGQTVYPPSAPIIVPTPQQPPPTKREKKTVSILVVSWKIEKWEYR